MKSRIETPLLYTLFLVEGPLDFTPNSYSKTPDFSDTEKIHQSLTVCDSKFGSEVWTKFGWDMDPVKWDRRLNVSHVLKNF